MHVTMASRHALDNRHIALVEALHRRGHVVSRWDAPRRIPASPDVALVVIEDDLDIGLPLCRAVHRWRRDLPVVALLAPTRLRQVTARWPVADIVLTSASGAEVELRLRRAVARSHRERPALPLRTWGLTLDEDTRALTVDARRVQLTHAEFDVLAALAQKPGVVLSRETLLDRRALGDRDTLIRNVDTVVSRLRRKLGPYAGRIETVRRRGYRFTDDDSARRARSTPAA